MPFTWAAKDPEEVLDYVHDWTLRLEGDSVVGPPLCVVESGAVTIDSTAIVGDLQNVWLSGGTVGDVRLTLTINTVGGRTYEEGIKLKIKER